MIIGLGTDIVRVERIADILARNGGSFIAKICTSQEKQYLQTCSDVSSKLAKLWAAKEATVKALGTGFVEGISFHDIELKHNSRGKPELSLQGKALQIMQQMVSEGEIAIHISLSDDKPWAQAVVIIEKI